MPDRSFDPILDKKAMDSLLKNSQYFIEVLGQPMEKGNELIFPLKNLPLTGFKIRYDIEKKFLGKIYVMVLEGEFKRGRNFYTSERIELRYSGFFKKGKPYFISVPLKKGRTNGNRMLQMLNGDEGLIEKCLKLDLEFLKVFFDFQKEAWKVQMRPYGGSFVQIMFPPMRYHVVLVMEQAELIYSVIEKMTQLIIGKDNGL